MKIYRIAQDDLYIDVVEMPDRIRVYIKRKDGQLNEFGEDFVGKLTLQFDAFSENKDMLTAFKIDPEYRDKGWGRKMMEALSPYQINPWYISPEPYGGNIGSQEYNEEIDSLHEMYGKFGFEEYKDNFMVKKFQRCQMKIYRIAQDGTVQELSVYCAWCKKHISGPQIEYIKASHGICPECKANVMKELDKEDNITTNS